MLVGEILVILLIVIIKPWITSLSHLIRGNNLIKLSRKYLFYLEPSDVLVINYDFSVWYWWYSSPIGQHSKGFISYKCQQTALISNVAIFFLIHPEHKFSEPPEKTTMTNKKNKSSQIIWSSPEYYSSATEIIFQAGSVQLSAAMPEQQDNNYPSLKKTR